MTQTKTSPMIAILPRLYTTDMTMLIRMAGLVLPHIFNNFLSRLDAEERRAIDKIMPITGGKKFYIKLEGSPTPPIVLELSNPPKITVMPEKDLEKNGIRGIKLRLDDVMPLTKKINMRNIVRFFWHLRGQRVTMLRIVWTFTPLLRLGKPKIKDMQQKLNASLKPLLGMFGT